jgi:hypothetical protein
MSSRSVSDIQTRAEGESLYIRYRSDANVLSYLKNDPSYEFKNKHCLKADFQSSHEAPRSSLRVLASN